LEGLSSEQQQRLTEILDRYFTSLEAGDPLDREDLLAEHPDLAEWLAAYLDSVALLQEAAVGIGGDALINPCAGDEDGSRLHRLGDFQIVREIGRGGMGIVYEAQQISLDRRVALKVLPWAALLDPKRIARFQNEAQAAAQLHHPHIVPVHFVGSDRGVYFYAMQYIDGKPLDRIIESLRRRATQNDSSASSLAAADNRFDSATLNSPAYFHRVAELGIQAAEALHAAHDYGVVHRDVKPSNLLIDREGKLWVTDFGLARCRHDAALTTTGDVVGTIRYMSPEQTIGRTAIVDHRCDIYSLGITLYELVTLRHAVRGVDNVTILRHLDRYEPYPPRFSNPSIPPDLETIILKAIARSRDERYDTARQLAEDLNNFLQGRSILARRNSSTDRLAKWARRHGSLVAASFAVLLLLVMILGATTLIVARQQSRTEDALATSHENWQRYRSQLALTHNHLGLLRQQNGDRAGAQQAFQQAVQLQRAMLAEHPHDVEQLQALATTLSNLSCLISATQPDNALVYGREALRLQKELLRLDPSDARTASELAMTYNNLGALYRTGEQYPSAAACYQRAIQLLTRMVDSPSASSADRDLAVAHNNLGRVQDVVGDHAAAEASYLEALRIQRGVLADRPQQAVDLSSLGGIHHNLGILRENRQQWQRAAEHYAKAIKFQSAARHIAPQSRRVRTSLSQHYANHFRVLLKLDRPQEAIEAAFARKALWPDQPSQLLAVAVELAECCARVQDSRDAADEQTWERCAALAVKTLEDAMHCGARLKPPTTGSGAFASLADYGPYRELLAAACDPPGQASLEQP
jgi:serine/threonine protein kinase